MEEKKFTVLLTNDDGPPGRESPYIFAFSQLLRSRLGCDVKVVIPSSQKSWIGKAFYIKEITRGKYFYPRHPDGLGETSEVSRPLKDGEADEWILLDTTPATCTNIALHNLFPGLIDLVVSGPNLGRNSSAAFALSSGTVGAALSGALSRARSIAVSYGTVLYPTPFTFHEPAHHLALSIIEKLWGQWGQDPNGMRNGEVDLYNINIPMIEKLLASDGLDVYWTRMWRNSYGRLFKEVAEVAVHASFTDNSDKGDNANSPSQSIENPSQLVFQFAPRFQDIISPAESDVPQGSDGWALLHGFASVTALTACYAEPSILDNNISDPWAYNQRKMKL